MLRFRRKPEQPRCMWRHWEGASMTTTTDLTPKRLDELAQWIEQPGHHPTRAESRALIAMARAKQAAERRVSRLEKHLSLECSEFEEGYQAALAGRDEGYAMAQVAERERDAWRAFARGTDVWDYEGLCACCHETDHTPDCLWTIADLAQPTDAGGA